MERSYGKRKEDTGYSGLPATIRELGWSFEVSVKVTGPGGEGPHTIIASQENTHREYAEFIQKGMSDKYAELNEEFKNRG